MTRTRPLRADAARNRESLLAAAAEEFAEHGLDASIADIARRAGIGKGTVFRHFPTKDDLLAAIVLDRIGTLNDVGGQLLTAADPGAALLEFLTFAARQQRQFDMSFLQEVGDINPEVIAAREEMFRTVGALVDRAREHGAVRDDITGTDVVLLMCAPKHVTSYLSDPPPDLWQRYLAIIFDGLRPQGAHPLPHPSP
ncbi:TetR/AcrR family transcriptional regulator [Saccharothrix coeruleofusca]|uniref:TetR family transcriptional regulator n=1 Tax=Saccharothrix coeruleofusca TaxID=33919 RepID=A0A918AI71_9PSEU|nr:TetR/AcrR family transcriptional regulator [Saccharothrix coeruleofusca]GGP39320.1 TetR family transcriptional regulator [Saccharothrix coeruleofusca]